MLYNHFRPVMPLQIPEQIAPLLAFNNNSTVNGPNPLDPPEQHLPRAVQFLADYSGCGLIRCGVVSHLLNFHQKAMVHDLTVMITDPNWYRGVKSVRIQRQATPHQREFVKFLKKVQQEHGFRIIYEVDDLIFREDIPDYNAFKFAFTSDEIRSCSQEIIEMCDEMTVTCDFMRDYYASKTAQKNITVIPNFLPRWWVGNFFSERTVSQNYDTYKSRPRILYAGSGAHFDVKNVAGQKDDFESVLKSVIDTRFKYKWVFIGAFPIQLKHYVENGDIEFHPWCPIYHYPKKVSDLKVQMMVAPLQDNNFNKAKSNLKWIEACAFGIPIACQNLCTYKEAEIKFDTGEEMIARIDEALSKPGHYKNQAIQRFKRAESLFLENDENIGCYTELFTTPYNDPSRVNLKRFN